MVAIVALIGRPNVGKSTLFNCLTCSNNALVANSPRLTRDRKYGYVEVAGRKFICIDTGGIDGLEEGVEIHVFKQSLLAIKEADIVLFVVDAKTGLMPADIMIAKYLHSHKKLTLLVANKVDNINQAIDEFYSLNLGNVYPITASHRRGINNLLEIVLLPSIDKIDVSFLKNSKEVECWSYLKLNEISKKRLKNDFDSKNLSIRLAIVGRQNVGKSTLINRILGEDRMIVYDMPGTTRDSVYIPIQLNNHKYILIDTAGVRKRRKINVPVEKLSIIKTLQAIEDSNVVILVINAREEISNQDLSLLSFIISSGRSLVIALNKCDGLNQEIQKQIRKKINYRLNFINFVRIHFISALYDKGIDNLFKSVHEAYHNAIWRISSAMLTRITAMATTEHQPPVFGKRRVKLKYAHIGGYNPLVIVIHGNQVKNLPESYRRYLINYFYKSLKISGAPIRIRFKEGSNPFINNLNY